MNNMENLLQRVIAQNEIIIRQNEELLMRMNERAATTVEYEALIAEFSKGRTVLKS